MKLRYVSTRSLKKEVFSLGWVLRIFVSVSIPCYLKPLFQLHWQKTPFLFISKNRIKNHSNISLFQLMARHQRHQEQFLDWNLCLLCFTQDTCEWVSGHIRVLQPCTPNTVTQVSGCRVWPQGAVVRYLWKVSGSKSITCFLPSTGSTTSLSTHTYCSFFFLFYWGDIGSL